MDGRENVIQSACEAGQHCCAGNNQFIVAHIDELEQWIQKQGIDKKDICLMGSSVLAAWGIRENHDLEIVLRPSIHKMHGFKRSFLWMTYRDNLSENLELWKNQLWRIGITDRRIFREKLYDVINGYNVLYLDIERLYKEDLGREKDLKDIERIKECAYPHTYEKRRYDRICRTIFHLLEYIEYYAYVLVCKLRRMSVGVVPENKEIGLFILWN